MTDGTLPARPTSYDRKIGLVLQGGGALGSYQAGVYEALASSEYLPDWVAGISIGAINAAITRRLPLPTLNHGMTHSLIAKITSGRNVVRGSSYNICAMRPAR
jgi:predicted acylesterase/phospholipase RssA